MKSIITLLILAAFSLTTALAQTSDDTLGIPIDSGGIQIDSLTLPDTPAMMELMDSALTADTLDASRMLELGQGDLSAGRIQEALSAFDQAVQLVPDDPRAQSLKGKALTMLGRNAEALPSLDKAIELDPHFAEARFNRAGAYTLMDKPEAALSDLETAFSEDTTLKSLARNSSVFQSLRANPQFQKLVK